MDQLLFWLEIWTRLKEALLSTIWKPVSRIASVKLMEELMEILLELKKLISFLFLEALRWLRPKLTEDLQGKLPIMLQLLQLSGFKNTYELIANCFFKVNKAPISFFKLRVVWYCGVSSEIMEISAPKSVWYVFDFSKNSGLKYGLRRDRQTSVYFIENNRRQ